MNPTEAQMLQFYAILDTLIDETTAPLPTNSITGDFIAAMLPYYRAAIDIAATLPEHSSHQPSRDIALDIISRQTRLIEALQQLPPECAAQPNTRTQSEQFRRTFLSELQTTLQELADVPFSRRTECNFIRQMLIYQRGATRLSQTALQRAICQQLTGILLAAAVDQQSTIRQLQTLSSVLKCAE